MRTKGTGTPMTTNTVGLSSEIADLFDLDPRSIPVADLGNVGRSADCTNDGCTASCNGCK
jgi:hypothetical protein